MLHTDVVRLTDLSGLPKSTIVTDILYDLLGGVFSNPGGVLQQVTLVRDYFSSGGKEHGVMTLTVDAFPAPPPHVKVGATAGEQPYMDIACDALYHPGAFNKVSTFAMSFSGTLYEQGVVNLTQKGGAGNEDIIQVHLIRTASGNAVAWPSDTDVSWYQFTVTWHYMIP